MFLKRNCHRMAFNIAVEIANKAEDHETEAFARLHLAMYGFAFEEGKGKQEARNNFNKAVELKKDSPQVIMFFNRISSIFN